MNIEIRGKNLNITDNIKTKIEDRLYSVSEKFPKQLIEEPNVHVDISQYDEVDGSHVRITLNTKKGVFHSEAKERDLFQAIDNAIIMIEKQIRHKIKK